MGAALRKCGVAASGMWLSPVSSPDVGVQVGEIVIRAGRAVDGDEIRLELDQIARNKTRGETQMPEDLNQQPAGVAARALSGLEGFLGRLHARLHADHIANLVGQAGVEANDEIDRSGSLAGNRLQKRRQSRTRRFGRPVDHQVRRDVLGIIERPLLGGFLDKEIERIVDRHVGDQFHLDFQFHHRIGEDITRHPVSIGILLVIDEMLFRADLERMRHHPRPAVRRGPQADDLRAERDRAIILIMGEMVNAGQN